MTKAFLCKFWRNTRPCVRVIQTWLLVVVWSYAPWAGAQDADVASTDLCDVATSGIMFCLPYEKGKAFRVIQGFGGRFSHYGFNHYAWDFDLPEGETVCAAAGGRVVCVQQSYTAPTFDPKGRTRANRIIIDHGHGIFSQYLHLKAHSALVREGDIVCRGQPIAKSGNTGYSTKPHLHFQVQNALGQSLPARFVDCPDGVPEEGKEYFSQNALESAYSFPGDSPFPHQVFTTNAIHVTQSSLISVKLRCDAIYVLAGKVSRSCRQIVVYLMPPDGGVPVWAQKIAVDKNGNFVSTISFAGARAGARFWSTTPDESNVFALAIAPVREDGTYWSDVSVPVFLR
ncbi:MAG: M23 family metallopeptidase [Candidatus Sumerlaeaceae bacterium]